MDERERNKGIGETIAVRGSVKEKRKEERLSGKKRKAEVENVKLMSESENRNAVDQGRGCITNGKD